MSRSSSVTGVNALLDKMKSEDHDFRYMALNDLSVDAQRGALMNMDQDLEQKVVLQVLELLKDTNGEVKNLAVRT